MGAIQAELWHKLPITLSELCINTTLRCGQSFRWRKNDDTGVWSMGLQGRILLLRQDPDYLYYRSHSSDIHAPLKATAIPPTPPSSNPPTAPPSPPKPDPDTLELLKQYLNLSPNLSELYAEWSTADPNFARKAPKFTGIRILRQPPWEALVGFICSSNNNIVRISQMMHKLCVKYGELLGHLDGEAVHDFPGPKELAQEGVEADLRALGFGYRAKYLAKTAKLIVEEREEGWLEGLGNPEVAGLGGKADDAGEWKPEGRDGYAKAHEGLLELQGVGPKVADCVSLFGLGWGEAVPVDTHVWQIAQRDYKFGRGKHSSLTKQTYDAVGNKFRSLWGKEAGWAHSVLFTADLKAFSERLLVKKEAKTEDVEIKKEEDGTEALQDVVKTEKLVEKGIKREAEEEKKVIMAEETVRRSKRRRVD